MSTAEWSIPIPERTKYDQIFDGLQPVKGLLTGDKIKPVLLNSKLPLDVLGRVWQLSDIDADGFLDREEFTVAMHLVYKALEKTPVPSVLPADMIPPSKRSIVISNISSNVQSNFASFTTVAHDNLATTSDALFANIMFPNQATLSQPIKWVVGPVEKAKSDELFHQSDTDLDGLVSGAEIKDIFLKTGLPQMTLAHIWNLCDTMATGKLNSDQFALAMHFVQQKLINGIDPPAQLTAEMMPPSLQESSLTTLHKAADSAGLKELETLANDIEDLKRDKLKLEQEKSQKEADVRIRNGEVAALQKELDAINSTVGQLGMQKAEAQKRLDELDDKRAKLELAINEMKEKCNEERKQGEDIELERIKEDLERLRQEENDLKQGITASQLEADHLPRHIADAQAEINKTVNLVQQLKEMQHSLIESIRQYDTLLTGGDVNDDHLTATFPPFSSSVYLNEETDPFKNNAGISADPFSFDTSVKADPFGGDPFTVNAQQTMSDSNKPFDTVFTTTTVSSDPFGTGTFAPSFQPSDWDANLFDSSDINSKTQSDIPVLPPKQKKAPAPPRPPAPKPSVDDPINRFRSGDSSNLLKPTNQSFEKPPRQFKSEAEQLEWATRDSKKEWEKLKQLQEQEQADLERAIALSKQA